MAYLNGRYYTVTGDNAVDSLTNGYKWDVSTNGVINWSISNGNNGEFWFNPSATSTVLKSVFDTISSYVATSFAYSGFYQDPTSARLSGADINISLDGVGIHTPGNGVWAVGYFPNQTDVNKGDIYLNINSQANYLPTYAPGSSGYALALHEIGHTLGLKHPHDDGGTGRPTFSDLGISWLDKDFISVMSYNDDYSWNNISWEPSTPMAMDVLALQFLYGKNTSTNAGDTTHYLTNDKQYKTIWDASGADVINLTKATEAWYVELPDVQVSQLVDTKVGYATPAASIYMNSPITADWLLGDIEGVFGSNYGDTIIGNALNNVIVGSKGNDFIDGGNGNDVSIYVGKVSDYQIVRNGDTFTVSHKMNGYDGVDTLKNVEKLNFSDFTLVLDQTSAVDTTVYHLYQAAFARIPDTAGFQFWANLADQQGLTAQQLATNFINSAEFTSKFGVNPTNAEYVTKLYTNVLGRAPDQEGLNFWIKQADAGLSHEQLLVNFATSNENVQLTGQHTADHVFWTV